MENLGEEIENLNGGMEDSIIDSNEKYINTENDTKIEKDTKVEKDNTLVKPEDLDGLQMLRLALEDNKTVLRKDIIPNSEVLINQQILLEDPTIITPLEGDDHNHHEVKCFQLSKPKIEHGSHISQDNSALEDPKPLEEIDDIDRGFETKKSEKYKGVEGAGVERKPALVRKEVNDLHGLTERQQKLLQDFHVKFVLEGVDVDEDDEARANRHPEFIELKKRLEEEEKMYAGCALSEASDVDQIGDRDFSTMLPQKLTTQISTKNCDDSVHDAIKDTMDGMINSSAEIAICHQSSSPRYDMKPLFQPQNVGYAMKGLVNNDGFSELQEYTDREGSPGCHCCCRKAGKQIDERDDSDVYMTHSSYSVLNVVCPVSGMPVVDLDYPVRSEECEHIYDRASALNYISSVAKDGFCLCASPGCRALLVENKLVADNRLWQDIEELRQIKAAMWESRMLQEFANIDDSDDD